MPIFEQEKELTDVEEQTLRQEVMSELFGSAEQKESPKETSLKEESSEDEKESIPSELKTNSEVDKDSLIAEVNKRLSAIETLNQTVSSMSFRLKQAEQRIGGLNNRLAEFKEGMIQTEIPKQDAPTKQQIESAAEDDLAWNNLKESFPDWATAIDKRIQAKEEKYVTKDEISEIRKQLTERKPVQKIENLPAQKVHIDPIEFRLLNIAHPDWQQVKESSEFDAWLRKQDVNILDKAQNSIIAEDAIAVLNLFKKEKVQISSDSNEIESFKAKRKERLKSSTTEKTNHQEIKPKADDELSLDEYRRKAAAEIFGK